MKGKKILIVISGAVVGFLGVWLAVAGNPPNMGMCIACFLRDTTGGLGLHRTAALQYVRPEILGLVLGAFISALVTREHRPVGGSSPLVRFTLAFFGMIGMMVFLGCPLRTLLRLSAGDLNALVGLAGLVAGVLLGVAFFRGGFSLGRAAATGRAGGYIFPAATALLLVFLLARAPFLFFSEQGPGSQHAPLFISLAAGLLIGVLAQRSRLCMVGGIRDMIMFGESYLLMGFVSLFVVALAANLAYGKFNLGFAGQPLAHTDGLWNFLGMALAGLCSVLLGGCPLRQLISAAEGNTDSAVTVFGLIAGAAFAHNFGLAASAKGVPAAGQAAVIIGFAVVLVIALASSKILERGGVARAGSGS